MSKSILSLDITGNPYDLSKWFRVYYLFCFKTGDTPRKYYCGITNDPVRRAKEHNVKKFIVCIRMKNADLAKRAERILGFKGFDVGKKIGNGDEDSCYVYMYKKIPSITIDY